MKYCGKNTRDNKMTQYNRKTKLFFYFRARISKAFTIFSYTNGARFNYA